MQDSLLKQKKKSNGFGGSSSFEEETFSGPNVSTNSDSIEAALSQTDELMEAEKQKLATRLANEEKDKQMSYSITGLGSCTC